MNQSFIHEELFKLQKELQTLDTAVKHIAQAEQIAMSVVQGVQTIQNNYAGLLEEVMNRYTSYLEQMSDSHKHLVNDTQQSLQQTAVQIQTEMQDSILAFSDEARQIVEAYSEKANILQEYLQDIPSQHEHHLQQFQVTLAAQIFEAQQKLHASTEAFSARVSQILTSLEKQLETSQKALEGSERLASQTQHLFERLERNDVPQHLDKLVVAMAGLNQGIQNVQLRIEIVERNVLPRVETLEQVVKEEMRNVTTTLLSKIKEQHQEIQGIHQEIQELKNRRWSFFRK